MAALRLVLLLLSCAPPSPPAPQHPPAPQRPPATQSPSAPPSGDLAGALPQSWRRLVEREGRLIDYRWCNADPVEVHLPAPGEDHLRWQWGQEEETLILRSVTWTETGARWEADRAGAPTTVTLAWTDPARGLAEIALGAGGADSFVATEHLGDFPELAEENCALP